MKDKKISLPLEGKVAAESRRMRWALKT